MMLVFFENSCTSFSNTLQYEKYQLSMIVEYKYGSKIWKVVDCIRFNQGTIRHFFIIMKNSLNSISKNNEFWCFKWQVRMNNFLLPRMKKK